MKTPFKHIPLSIAFFLCLASAANALDVTLQWDANTETDLAGYKVYYDTNSGVPYNGTGATEGNAPINMPLGSDENSDPNIVEYTLHNLPGGTYYFAVTAYNSGGLESGYSNEVNTGSTPDTTPPVISNVQVTSTTDTSATIQWTTDETSDSQVRYGINSGSWASYPSSKTVAGLVTSHSVTLTGLSANTTYYFRVGSTDGSGNGPTTSSEYSFNTIAAPDTNPPSIVQYPTINYTNNTIDMAYDESNIQNATTESNYAFSPSLLFRTLGGSDDIANVGGNTYRLSMKSIPGNTIFTMTVNSITDAAGNPVTPNSIKINDNDNDGMADDWELTSGVSNPAGDPDSDGLNNLEEFNNGTNPNNPDTDGDTLPDGWEVTYGLDPTDGTGANGKNGDFDGDGWTNYEEYTYGYNPASSNSPAPTPPEVRKTIPRHNSGITNKKRVPTNTSFAVLLQDADGIDITDTTSIKFTINDGVNSAYVRDLNNGGVFRVVKLTSDPDTAITKFWAVYDRPLDTYGVYPYDKNINIKVDAKDVRGTAMAQASYSFNIESLTEHNNAQNNEPYTVTLTNTPSSGQTTISISSGLLTDTMITYENNEPVKPTFGPPGEVPAFGAQGVTGVYYPLNLQPPTVFNTPVKVFIPLPDVPDVSDLVVGLYDGENWVVACDASGNVLPDAEGWMVPGSRVNHNNGNPPYIELQVYHFSGVQAGSSSAAFGIGSAEEKGAGGCFIGTAASSSQPGVERVLRNKKIGVILVFVLLMIVAIGVHGLRRRGSNLKRKKPELPGSRLG